ncbi:hypothetical protein ACLBXO_26010 [Methylobacterium sp. C33D]
MPKNLLDAREPVQRRLADLLDDHAHGHGGLAIASGIVRHAGGGADETRAETMRQFRAKSAGSSGSRTVTASGTSSLTTRTASKPNASPIPPGSSARWSGA